MIKGKLIISVILTLVIVYIMSFIPVWTTNSRKPQVAKKVSSSGYGAYQKKLPSRGTTRTPESSQKPPEAPLRDDSYKAPNVTKQPPVSQPAPEIAPIPTPEAQTSVPINEGWLGPVRSSYFGGPQDAQPVAYPYQGMGHTSQLDAAGVPYFASRNPSWAGKWVEFKVGDRIAKGVQADYGPATWTGRYFDFGPPLGQLLDYRTDRLVYYRLLF